jgi:hypothetical protein
MSVSRKNLEKPCDLRNLLLFAEPQLSLPPYLVINCFLTHNGNFRNFCSRKGSFYKNKKIHHSVDIFTREQMWKQTGRVDGLNEGLRFPVASGLQMTLKKGHAL